MGEYMAYSDNHVQGDKNEELCKQILLKRWPNARIIETKRNAVQGIDFAVDTGDKCLMIVEVKSAHSSLADEQMSLGWVGKNLTDEFKSTLRDAHKQGYTLGRVVYRVSPAHSNSNDDLCVIDTDGQKYTLSVMGKKDRQVNGTIAWEDMSKYIYSDIVDGNTKSSSAFAQTTTNVGTNAQSLQKQLDSCRDFHIAIDDWIKYNQKSIEDLQIAIQEAIRSNTLSDFRKVMNQYWKVFDGLTQESILLLIKQKKGFQTQAKVIIEKQQSLGQKSQHNHISNGFVNNLKTKLK